MLVGAIVALSPLPFDLHVTAPGALSTTDRVEPGSRQYVHGTFGVLSGDSIDGRVVVLSGPSVVLYILDESQFERLRASGLVEEPWNASGANIQFLFKAPASGTYHLVVGHSPGNETLASGIEVACTVVVSPLLVGWTFGSHAVGSSLFLVGIRLHTRALLQKEFSEARRGVRPRKRRK